MHNKNVISQLGLAVQEDIEEEERARLENFVGEN